MPILKTKNQNGQLELHTKYEKQLSEHIKGFAAIRKLIQRREIKNLKKTKRISSQKIKIRLQSQETGLKSDRIQANLGCKVRDLKKKYADLHGIQANILVFKFKGRILENQESPKSINLGHYDVIKVHYSIMAKEEDQILKELEKMSCDD